MNIRYSCFDGNEGWWFPTLLRQIKQLTPLEMCSSNNMNEIHFKVFCRLLGYWKCVWYTVTTVLILLQIISPSRDCTTYTSEPVYWWNENILQLCEKCNSARQEKETNVFETEGCLQACTIQISKSYKPKRMELIVGVGNDPCSMSYNVVMTQIKGHTRRQPTCPEQLKKIVGVLLNKA